MKTYEIQTLDPTTGESQTSQVEAERASYNEDRDLVLLYVGDDLVGRFSSILIFKPISTT